jgi:hypothetical protein
MDYRCFPIDSGRLNFQRNEIHPKTFTKELIKLLFCSAVTYSSMLFWMLWHFSVWRSGHNGDPPSERAASEMCGQQTTAYIRPETDADPPAAAINIPASSLQLHCFPSRK